MTIQGEDGSRRSKQIIIEIDAGELMNQDHNEKTPLSSMEIETYQDPAYQNDKPNRTLARLTIGCSIVSILLITVGTIGNQLVLLTEGIHTFADVLCYLVAWIVDVKSRQRITDQVRKAAVSRCFAIEHMDTEVSFWHSTPGDP
jgi:hypothetical protein